MKYLEKLLKIKEEIRYLSIKFSDNGKLNSDLV